MRKDKDWIHIARTKIRTEWVLRDLFGIDVPEGAGSWRTDCPLGMEHSDGGRAKALRVFSESNTARCFSHNMSFDPITLWKLKNSTLGLRKPAMEVLNFYGISTDPPTRDERWVNTEKNTKVDSGDGIKEAIIFFAQHQLPNYSTLQYNPDVLELMNNILEDADILDSDASYGILDTHMSKYKGILKSYWREHGWN